MPLVSSRAVSEKYRNRQPADHLDTELSLSPSPSAPSSARETTAPLVMRAAVVRAAAIRASSSSYYPSFIMQQQPPHPPTRSHLPAHSFVACIRGIRVQRGCSALPMWRRASAAAFFFRVHEWMNPHRSSWQLAAARGTRHYVSTSCSIYVQLLSICCNYKNPKPNKYKYDAHIASSAATGAATDRRRSGGGAAAGGGEQ